MTLTRRHCLTCSGLGLLSAAFAGAMPLAHAAAPAKPTALTPDQVLQTLREGNRRFRSGGLVAFDTSPAKRSELANGQAPLAVVLCCSDSRVPPELLFSCGLGDLFIVRNAGNTVSESVMGSIEYALLVLQTPLLVVMGHEGCGAVQAAVELVETNREFPGSLSAVIEPIVPAVLQVRNRGNAQERLDLAVRANVTRTVRWLQRESEPMFGKLMKENKLKIVGARYDLDEGQVDFIA